MIEINDICCDMSASTVRQTGAWGCQVRRRTDLQARSRARQFLNKLTGPRPTDLSWDDTFRLQGHARVGRCELIVIAPRDQEHEPVVLTVEDWDELRRDGGNSAALVSDRAIVTRRRLDAVLAEHIVGRTATSNRMTRDDGHPRVSPTPGARKRPSPVPPGHSTLTRLVQQRRAQRAATTTLA